MDSLAVALIRRATSACLMPSELGAPCGTPYVLSYDIILSIVWQYTENRIGKIEIKPIDNLTINNDCINRIHLVG